MNLFKSKPKPAILHCCTQKTASQWFITFLNDVLKESCNKYKVKSFIDYRSEVIFKKTNFSEPSYELQHKLYSSTTDFLDLKAIKGASMYSGFYIGPSFANHLRNQNTKTFFVLRDPRDLVVSWYYSSKYSHPPSKDINRVRAKLQNCSFNDGIKYSIDQMNDFGLFCGVKNWIEFGVSNCDLNVRILLFDDFVERYQFFCESLITYLELKIDSEKLVEFIEKHSFKKYSGGRAKGDSDNSSHFRSARPNQWKDEFDAEIIEYFKLKTNDLDIFYEDEKSKFRL